MMPFTKDAQTMFFVFARQKGSSKWIEQESSESVEDVKYWAKRNNERNTKEFEEGAGREYVSVKRITTFEEV